MELKEIFLWDASRVFCFLLLLSLLSVFGIRWCTMSIASSFVSEGGIYSFFSSDFLPIGTAAFTL